MNRTEVARHRSIGRWAKVVAPLLLAGLLMAALPSGARKDRFTIFNVPGAGTGSGQGTYPAGINATGVMTGFYEDASNVLHGWVRAVDGSIITFDAAGAGTGAFQGTDPYDVNASGEITGIVDDASNDRHGFVRAEDGTVTAFDAPGAGTGAHQGTMPRAINASGQIVGDYIDASGVAHGFLYER